MTKDYIADRKKIISIAVLVAVVFTTGILAWKFIGRSVADRDDPSDTGKASGSLVAANDMLIVNKETQRLSGIETKRLVASRVRRDIKAYGQVLDPQSLIELRNNYVTAEANVRKSIVQLMVSKNEYNRVNALFNFNRNVSQKELQSAQAAYDSDKADSEAAVQNLSGLKGEIRHQWGNVIANWIVEHSPVINELIENKLSLLLITIPPASAMGEASRTADISVGSFGQTADREFFNAQLVSASPKTNPSVQGASYFYMASANAELSSGTNIVAHLPVGKTVEGVVIPDSAVVWWDGYPWVYIKSGKDEFVRKVIVTKDRTTGGWFVTDDVKPGDEVVVRGAQLLLSSEGSFGQEFKAQVKAGDD